MSTNEPGMVAPRVFQATQGCTGGGLKSKTGQGVNVRFYTKSNQAKESRRYTSSSWVPTQQAGGLELKPQYFWEREKFATKSYTALNSSLKLL
jgi:hypothetical protein